MRKHEREELDENLKRLSYEEHRENALAPRAEEGRDKLRKSTGIGKYEMIRGSPNGETYLGEKA